MKKAYCAEELSKIFPAISFATIENIIFQEFQRKMKNTHYIHQQSDRRTKYYKLYQGACKQNEKAGFLLKLAEEVELSPSLLARIILEQHYSPLTVDDEPVTRQKITDMLKNTSLIDDGKLASEIHLCVLNDRYYGPLSDIIRRCVGLDYEKKLKKELDDMGITYIDEQEMREKGYDKTPDIKLELPVAFDGHVINWIESKASFGDIQRHNEYLDNQYWGYHSRFGTGLVIYWFGFVDEIDVHKEQGIFVSQCLPQNFISIAPLSQMTGCKKV